MKIINLINGDVSYNDFLNFYNIKPVYYILPKRIYGFVFSYKENNFIVINKNTGYSTQKHTLLHELAHIELSHINNYKLVLEFSKIGLEDEADLYIKNIVTHFNQLFLCQVIVMQNWLDMFM